MKKKKYVTRQALIQRMLALCLEINGLEKQRDRSMVFFNYSPHVQNISIDVHIGGWYDGKHADERLDMYVDKKRFSYGQYQYIMQYLKELRDANI